LSQLAPMSSPARVPSEPLVWPGRATELPQVHARPRPVVALFATTLFASACLMFVVEPMVAKMLLPSLGGAPAVWNTCLVFFQAMLLAGYAYAHGATQLFGIRRHVILHSVLILLPLLVLPIGLQHVTPDSGQEPVAWLLIVLVSSIGLPFFVLSTSAAVLQKWFSATDDESAGDPYFLYAASNLGSFVALLAYPVVLEPTLRLQEQSALWTLGYGIFATLTVACAALVWRRTRAGVSTRQPRDIAEPDTPISWWRRGHWVALAFVPSSLLLAVTNYISTDVASVPLLWVLPLALYLLGFGLAFSPSARRASGIATRLMPLLALVLTLVLIADWTSPLSLIIPLHLAAFFTIALACHSDLAHDRPSTRRLTEFYFWIALGGMFGGLFNALLAPVVFNSIIEYPLVLVAACLLRAVTAPREDRWLGARDLVLPAAIGLFVAAAVLINNQFGWSRYIVLEAAVPALVAFSQRRHAIRFAACIAAILIAGSLAESRYGPVVYAERTFFGVNRVRVDEGLGYRFLFHGTTIHGMQRLDPARQHEPLSYFHQAGPAGQIFAGVPKASDATDIAVVGLGVGTLASYRTPSQHWTYYEIDPAVERIARDTSYFTYLSACGDGCRIVTGDGRLSLAQAKPHQYGLILLDAFSSDAVPMHLLTREAIDLYLSKLEPGGVIAFHISNLHLSLARPLARLASDAGLAALWQAEPPYAGSWSDGKFPTEWFIVARDQADFGRLNTDTRWKIPTSSTTTPLWTDDFSNILSALR